VVLLIDFGLSVLLATQPGFGYRSRCELARAFMFFAQVRYNLP
jgi:hypothetical protein